ncbi:MAG TPA: hypothetical protein VGC52_07940 [Gemmatimonadaceae bacterium]
MPRLTASLICSIGLIACTQNGNVAENPPDTPAGVQPPAQAAPPARSDNGFTPEQQTEWNAIEALEVEAKAIAKIDGCVVSSACRTAPVGSRGCGGPRYYIPWCSASTDSAALYAKLAQVAKAEQAFNAKYSMASTCEMRLAPAVVSSGGSCITQ